MIVVIVLSLLWASYVSGVKLRALRRTAVTLKLFPCLGVHFSLQSKSEPFLFLVAFVTPFLPRLSDLHLGAQQQLQLQMTVPHYSVT